MEKISSFLIQAILGLMTGFALYKLSTYDKWKARVDDKIAELDRDKDNWRDVDRKIGQLECRVTKAVGDLDKNISEKLDLIIKLQSKR